MRYSDREKSQTKEIPSCRRCCITPEYIFKNIDAALREAWQFITIPDIVFVKNELAEIMISIGCKSKKKRQRKKWAKKHGFRRFKVKELYNAP